MYDSFIMRIVALLALVFLISCTKPNTTGSFSLKFEIPDTSIREVSISYRTDIGLTGITKHVKKNTANTIDYQIDSITNPISVFLTIGKDYYKTWAEPNSDLCVYYNIGAVNFSGKSKKFADYYLESKKFHIRTYSEYQKRDPVLAGKPSGSKYFKVQDSITNDRIQFLNSFFPKPRGSSVKQFIEYESTELLYTDLFFKITGVTSLKEFRFYQEATNNRVDTFLAFTDKFDFNNPDLFKYDYYWRPFITLPGKYIKENKLDYIKDKRKAHDFIISLSTNELNKKCIEIHLLNNLINQSIESKDYSQNTLIKERLDRLSANKEDIEKYLNILKVRYDDLLESEKKSKYYISLLSNPKTAEGIQIQDFSKNKELDLLKSIILKYPGKVLYIDFWAPWCVPCMGEMPYTKKIQKKYENKNVVFVYLGVDCTEESWRNTIAEKKLSGIHYLLTKEQGESYYKIFEFSGIPRYLIIDQKGLVIDTNAPRPSEETKLAEIFNKLTSL